MTNNKDKAYLVTDKSAQNIQTLYEQFLSNKELSGLTSSPVNYKNAFNRDEMKQALKNTCGTINLYEVIDVVALQKVRTELLQLQHKFASDKTKSKRCKDCSSYINKYISFIESCDFTEENEHEGGCVYIITNPAFKKFYIKIGSTSKTAAERVRDLYDTSVPTPFDLFAVLRTPKFKQAEKMMHKALQDDRISPDREFFYMLPDVALEQLKVIAEGLEGEIDLYGKNGKVIKTLNYKK